MPLPGLPITERDSSAVACWAERVPLAMLRTQTRLPSVRFLVWWGMLGLTGLVFTLSCLLVVVRPVEGESGERSVAAALFGESRLALSGHFYEMADMYFHRGVEHIREEAFSDGFFQKIYAEFSPRKHVHVAGHDVNEIMPWLKLAIRMDPHNVELYTVTAFWLATEGGHPNIALNVLHQALAHNPYCYQAQLELGRIYLRMERLQEAKRAFDAGLAFWEKAAQKESRDARWDKAALLLYRALLHEADGETELAAAQMREVVSMFPERKGLLARIAALEKGESPLVNARRYWKNVLVEETKQRAACKHTAEHEDHHEEADHHFTGEGGLRDNHYRVETHPHEQD